MEGGVGEWERGIPVQEGVVKTVLEGYLVIYLYLSTISHVLYEYLYGSIYQYILFIL